MLVDTSVWIDYFRGRRTPHTEWLDQAFARVRVSIPDMALAELLQGVSEPEALRLEAELEAIRVVDVGGGTIAKLAAANYRKLRRRGFTVRGTIDCFIATYAIEHGIPLLHCDRDFRVFEEHLNLRAVSDLEGSP
ncbi:MAG: PIN domain nuclease [Phycisphaerae bacterium]|nr:PIN domain nuclease [Phycisphaerae bacterium]